MPNGEVPTTIGGEPKESREGLSEEQKGAMATRHRSVAQLKRHGAEVTAEGRLEVTPAQIERARSVMERELRERMKEELEKALNADKLGDFLEHIGKINDLAGKLAESRRSRESQRAKVKEEEEEKRRQDEREAFPGGLIGAEQSVGKEAETGDLGLRERIENVFGRFVEGVNSVLERWTAKVEDLARRAETLGAVVKWSAAVLAEAPRWLVRELQLSSFEGKVSRAEEKIRHDEEVYTQIIKELEEGVDQQIKAAEERLAAQLDDWSRITKRIESEARATYSERIQSSTSDAEKRLREEQLRVVLAGCEAQFSAERRRLQAEVYRKEAEIMEKYSRALNAISERYLKSTDTLAERLHSAVDARNKWRMLAEESRAKAQRLRVAWAELTKSI